MISRVPRQFQRIRRRVHVRHTLGPGGQRVHGKRARVGKAIQHLAPAQVRRDLAAIVALVEVKAGLVPALDVHQEAQAVLADFHQVGRLVAGQHARRLRQAFLGAHVHVAALVDAFCRTATLANVGPTISFFHRSMPSVRNCVTSQSP